MIAQSNLYNLEEKKSTFHPQGNIFFFLVLQSGIVNETFSLPNFGKIVTYNDLIRSLYIHKYYEVYLAVVVFFYANI